MAFSLKKKKNFDETHWVSEYEERKFFVVHDYSHYSDYKVYKNKVSLSCATSINDKLQFAFQEDVFRKVKKEDNTLEDKLFEKFCSDSQYNSCFIVMKGLAILHSTGKTFGTDIILGGDLDGEYCNLKEGDEIRIVRRNEKTNQ
jgi:hypothetical protein|tara:strand:+ start:6761 stop:7192 length:432 start_codon:yes stop_codon:yes gene_type:complete